MAAYVLRALSRDVLATRSGYPGWIMWGNCLWAAVAVRKSPSWPDQQMKQPCPVYSITYSYLALAYPGNFTANWLVLNRTPSGPLKAARCCCLPAPPASAAAWLGGPPNLHAWVPLAICLLALRPICSRSDIEPDSPAYPHSLLAAGPSLTRRLGLPSAVCRVGVPSCLRRCCHANHWDCCDFASATNAVRGPRLTDAAGCLIMMGVATGSWISSRLSTT
jgi:hypothetical protein